MAEDNGKVRHRRLESEQSEIVIAATDGKRIRANHFWTLYDYATGGDALADAKHKAGADEAVAHYKKNNKQGGLGVRFVVAGFASNYAKDPRYDNRALAVRRRSNVARYLSAKGVSPRDMRDGGFQVVGNPGLNKAEHRSVVIAAGHPANELFRVIWYVEKESNDPFDFFDNLLEIWDLQWKLAATYRVVPIDKASVPTRPSGLYPPGPRLADQVQADLMTGPATVKPPGSEKPEFVPVTAFHQATVTLLAESSVIRISGTTPREKVSFDALGTNPRVKEFPGFTFQTRRVAKLVLAKPTLDPIE